MPRDSNGNYTLPLADVNAGEYITSTWANTTLADLAAAMTGSLARSGVGEMSGPLKLADGTDTIPGLSFFLEDTAGFYRAGTNDFRSVVSSIDQIRFTLSGPEVWDEVAGLWFPVVQRTAGSVATLVTMSLSAGVFVTTQGYYGPGTSGAGNYFIKTAAQASTDGDIVDEQGAGFTLANGNVAILQRDSQVAIFTQFGGRGNGYDGGVNNSAAIVAAVAAATTVVFPSDEFRVYSFVDPITINKNNVELRGDDGADILISPRDAGVDCLIISPTNPELNNFISGVILNNLTVYTAQGDSGGVGIKLYNTQGLKVDRVDVLGFQYGIDIKGIDNAKFSNFYAAPGSTVTTPTAGSYAMSIEGYPLSGSGFSVVWTAEFVNFTLSAGDILETSLILNGGDVAHFTNGYISAATSQLVKVDLQEDEQYSSFVFSSVYFDGIGGVTPTALKVVDNSGATNSSVASAKLIGCNLHGFSGNAVDIEGRVSSFRVISSIIKDTTGWALMKSGSNNCEASLSGCDIRNVGGGASIESAVNFGIVDNLFTDVSGEGINLNGSPSTGNVNSNRFQDVTTAITNTATFSGNYRQVGNVSSSEVIVDV